MTSTNPTVATTSMTAATTAKTFFDGFEFDVDDLRFSFAQTKEYGEKFERSFPANTD